MSDEVLQRRLARAQAKVRLLEGMIEDKTRELFVAHRDVQRNHDELREILASMPSAVVVIDGDGTIQRANQAAIELLGFDESDLVGAPLSCLGDDPLLQTPRRLIDEGSLLRGQVTYQRRDGEDVPVLFSSAVLRDGDGRPAGAVCIALDLTELRKLRSLNVQLEEQVQRRTLELDVRVRELEGRDRIAQHMLTVHSPAETMSHLLDVVVDTVGVERSCLYLVEEGRLRLRAARAAAESLDVASIPLGSRRESLQRVLRSKCAVRVADGQPPFAAAPLLRGDDLMGLVLVDSPEGREPVTGDQVTILASLCRAGAAALHDAQAQSDLGSWRAELRGVLDSAADMEDAAPDA